MNLRKNILILLTLLVTSISAQEINDNFIIGSWKVVKLEKTPKEPPFSLMAKSFEKAKFHFNKDRTNSIETSVPNKFFSMLKDSMIDLSKWHLELINKQKIIVLEKEPIVAKIIVEVIDNNVFFDFFGDNEKASFLLKVEKVKK